MTVGPCGSMVLYVPKSIFITTPGLPDHQILNEEDYTYYLVILMLKYPGKIGKNLSNDQLDYVQGTTPLIYLFYWTLDLSTSIVILFIYQS
jgi:hypothetical protein